MAQPPHKYSGLQSLTHVTMGLAASPLSLARPTFRSRWALIVMLALPLLVVWQAALWECRTPSRAPRARQLQVTALIYWLSLAGFALWTFGRSATAIASHPLQFALLVTAVLLALLDLRNILRRWRAD